VADHAAAYSAGVDEGRRLRARHDAIVAADDDGTDLATYRALVDFLRGAGFVHAELETSQIKLIVTAGTATSERNISVRFGPAFPDQVRMSLVFGDGGRVGDCLPFMVPASFPFSAGTRFPHSAAGALCTAIARGLGVTAGLHGNVFPLRGAAGSRREAA
jgi:hypothetical protein